MATLLSLYMAIAAAAADRIPFFIFAYAIFELRHIFYFESSLPTCRFHYIDGATPDDIAMKMAMPPAIPLAMPLIISPLLTPPLPLLPYVFVAADVDTAFDDALCHYAVIDIMLRHDATHASR